MEISDRKSVSIDLCRKSSTSAEMYTHATSRAMESATLAHAPEYLLYFPDASAGHDGRRLRLVASVAEALSRPPYLDLLHVVDGTSLALVVRASQLLQDCGGSGLGEALAYAPDEALACLACGAHFAALRSGLIDLLLGKQHQGGQTISVQLTDLPERPLGIQNITAEYYGRLISLRAQPVACLGPEQQQQQGDGSAIGCSQRVRVRDLSDPRHQLEVRLRGSLPTPPFQPLLLVGILRAEAEAPEGGRKRAAAKAAFTVHLDAGRWRCPFRPRLLPAANASLPPLPVSAVPLAAEGGRWSPLAPPPFGLRDLTFVEAAHAQHGDGMFAHLVHALCPSLFGRTVVKAALLLALVGAPDRGLKLLLVSEGAAGGSQLLRAAQAASSGASDGGSSQPAAASCAPAPLAPQVAVRARAGAGGRGIVHQQAACGAFAGSVPVLFLEGLGGPGELPALLAMMQRGRATTSYAGARVDLPVATTGVVAAVAAGSYDRSRPWGGQSTRLDPAATASFDLVFLLLDAADEAADIRASEAVLGLHGGGGAARASRLASQRQRAGLELLPSRPGEGAMPDLRESLVGRVRAVEGTTPMPVEVREGEL